MYYESVELEEHYTFVHRQSYFALYSCRRCCGRFFTQRGHKLACGLVELPSLAGRCRKHHNTHSCRVCLRKLMTCLLMQVIPSYFGALFFKPMCSTGLLLGALTGMVLSLVFILGLKVSECSLNAELGDKECVEYGYFDDAGFGLWAGLSPVFKITCKNFVCLT